MDENRARLKANVANAGAEGRVKYLRTNSVSRRGRSQVKLNEARQLGECQRWWKLLLRSRPEDGGSPLERFTLHGQDHVPDSCVLAVHCKRDEAVPFERDKSMT